MPGGQDEGPASLYLKEPEDLRVRRASGAVAGADSARIPGGVEIHRELAYDGRMRHIGIGRIHAGTPVVKIIRDRHVIIADKRTEEVLRELILDPTRDYQPRGSR